MNRLNPILPLVECKMDYIGCSMDVFSLMMEQPDSNNLVSIRCRYCGEPIQCRYVMSPFVSCDKCIEDVLYKQRIEFYREYWERVCPINYRETNVHFKADRPDQSDFPLAIWEEYRLIDKAKPGQNFFLYGPSGTGKTRVAFLLLKAALLRGNRVGVLWPEKLSTLKTSFKTDVFDHYANYDVLLLDDALLTACKESDMVDSLKMIVDVRMREKRPMIFTSQIGETGVQDGKQYGEVKSSDLERIAALMRRLREACTVISFAKAIPKDGEQPY